MKKAKKVQIQFLGVLKLDLHNIWKNERGFCSMKS